MLAPNVDEQTSNPTLALRDSVVSVATSLLDCLSDEEPEERVMDKADKEHAMDKADTTARLAWEGSKC